MPGDDQRQACSEVGQTLVRCVPLAETCRIGHETDAFFFSTLLLSPQWTLKIFRLSEDIQCSSAVLCWAVFRRACSAGSGRSKSRRSAQTGDIGFDKKQPNATGGGGRNRRFNIFFQIKIVEWWKERHPRTARRPRRIVKISCPRSTGRDGVGGFGVFPRAGGRSA